MLQTYIAIRNQPQVVLSTLHICRKENVVATCTDHEMLPDVPHLYQPGAKWLLIVIAKTMVRSAEALPHSHCF